MKIKPTYPASLPAADSLTGADEMLGLRTVSGKKVWYRFAKVAWSKITGAPTALKNPSALTFTGAVADSYDGSAPKSVAIPTALKNPKTLTIVDGASKTSTAYNGDTDRTVLLPTELKNPKALRIIYDNSDVDLGALPPGDVLYDGGEDRVIRIYLPKANREVLAIIGEKSTLFYDGSTRVNYTPPRALPNPQPLTVRNVPGSAAGVFYDGSDPTVVTLPVALPNPHPLKLTGLANAAYDGSAPLEVYIPVRLPQPTGMALKYPSVVSVRNAVLQRIEAQLLPAFVMQDCLIFLPAGGDAIELYPDGTFRVRRVGTSKVYIMPTMAASAYRAIDITVRNAVARRTGSGVLRRTSAGKLRIN